MYRKVIVWPQRALYKESRSVELKEPDFTKLDDLVDTFRVIQGYGLAAPQIGHQIRAFVINHHALNIDGYDGEYIEIINPSIKCSGNEFISTESCFSVPEVSVRIKRYENCELTFFDRTGKSHTIFAVGQAAACIQHEYDHLDGKLLLNRVSSLKRSMLTRKINKIRKKKAQAIALAKKQFEEDSLLYSSEPTREKRSAPSRKRKKRVKRQKRKRK